LLLRRAHTHIHTHTNTHTHKHTHTHTNTHTQKHTHTHTHKYTSRSAFSSGRAKSLEPSHPTQVPPSPTSQILADRATQQTSLLSSGASEHVEARRLASVDLCRGVRASQRQLAAEVDRRKEGWFLLSGQQVHVWICVCVFLCVCICVCVCVCVW